LIPAIKKRTSESISSGVNPVNQSFCLSKVNTNCHGLSAEEVDAFFVPGVDWRNVLKSSATSLRSPISFELFALSFTHTGDHAGGQFSTVATSTSNHSDFIKLSLSNTSVSRLNTVI